MIEEVDEALRRLVRETVPVGAGTEVVLDAPTRDWAARRTGPTVDLYLYDVREDLRRRSRGLVNAYGPDGRVEARHRPPRYVRLSYLLTAWTQRPEDEHRLLSDLLARFLHLEALPRAVLGATLDEIGLPVPFSVALPPEDRSSSDLWSALGGELKPSLDVLVSVPVLPREDATAAPAPEEIVVDLGGEVRRDLPAPRERRVHRPPPPRTARAGGTS